MEHWHQIEFPEPWGTLWIRFDGAVLTGIRSGIQGPGAGMSGGTTTDNAAFRETSEWLRRYFSGEREAVLPRFALLGVSPFVRRVLETVQTVPYGRVVTYGEVAERIAPGGRRLARAVGAALGRNPILIAVPCHRVVGQGGRLTGYAGGVALKRALLKLEGASIC